MALTGGDEKQEMRMAGALLYDSIENLDQEHHLMRPNSGGGGNGGAAPTPPGFGGGSKPKPAGAAVTGGFGRNNSTCGIRYRECLKNHAAAIGGNVTDGCGEFMPSGEDGSLEAFKCAACSCHRNFHRKEGGSGDNSAMVVHPLNLTPQLHGSGGGTGNHWTASMVHPMKMAFGGSGGGGGSGSAATDSSSEELNFNVYQSSGAAPPPQFVVAKKRHRTKFSADQKEKMLAFAEKLGWRIPREDDTEVQRFCGEVGVKRQVFKVWMHNNKNSASSAKKTMTPQEHLHQHQHHEQQQQQQLHHE